jgi:MFS transporter, DHA2 family, multidrug resistance protein
VSAIAPPVTNAAPPVPATFAAHCPRPVVGVVAVLLGAFLSSLNTRLTTFGLADIRGGLGLGFDEGSWLQTAFGAAQMVVAPSAAWLSIVVGTRRFLLWASVIFALTSLLIPFTRDYQTIIALTLVRGLAVGTFIPASLGFILRSLVPKWWIWGLAAYSFRFVFSQNVAGSIEAVYSENGAWQWIFWQNAVLAPVMTALVWYAMPREGVNRTLLRQTDWNGILLAGAGFGLIYAGLDQGNRLDWFNSGVVTGFFVGGGLLIAGFFVCELLSEHPLLRLRVVAKPNVWGPAVQISIYSFGVAATAFILPDFLTRVQGLRDLQIGDTLNWIAVPQFVLVPLATILLRRTDARILIAVGFALMAYGSWLDTGLTHEWVGRDFLPSQIIEAVGLAFGITALIVFGVSNITPADAATIAAAIQTARTLGNESGQRLGSDLCPSARTGLLEPDRAPFRDRLASRRARGDPVFGAVCRAPDRRRQSDLARLRIDRQLDPPRSLCTGLYRRVLAHRLGTDRRHCADAVSAASAPQSPDPATQRPVAYRPSGIVDD